MLSRAIEVFEDREAAERWLECPSRPLGNVAPSDLLALESEAGMHKVLAELIAIEHGLPL